MKALRASIKERKKDGEYVLCDRATCRKSSIGIILTSYYTDVCYIDNNGIFHKIWHGYSKTTLKHINIFRELWSMNSMNKKEWVLYEE